MWIYPGHRKIFYNESRLPPRAAPAVAGTGLVVSGTHLAHMSVLLASVLLVAVAALLLAILVIRLRGLLVLRFIRVLVHTNSFYEGSSGVVANGEPEKGDEPVLRFYV